MKIRGILIISSLVLAAVVTGCTQAVASSASQPSAVVSQVSTPQQQEPAKSSAKEPVKVVTPAADANAIKSVRVADILNNPKVYNGKKVIVEGKIVSECGSGCWFTLKDGNAVIYIDLAPNNMVIPQKKGSFARVTAVVEYVGSDVYLIGSKVDF